MIDFRYHLISLIAVFLALGLGILMGSVVLSEKYVDRLERRVEDLAGSLDESRQEVAALEERVDGLQAFAREAEPLLVDAALAGEEIVVFVMDGTDPALIDAISDTIESAGGTIASTISLTSRFELVDQTAREQLGFIVGSSMADPQTLREQAGAAIGDRAAAAAAADFGDLARRRRLITMLADLQENDFVGVSSNEEMPVPNGASFIVAGGSVEEPADGAVPLALSLATALGERGGAVMVVGITESRWDLVETVREDPSGATIATVDHADTVPGRVAVVLGMAMAIDGIIDHYGTAEGAAAILPPPTPAN